MANLYHDHVWDAEVAKVLATPEFSEYSLKRGEYASTATVASIQRTPDLAELATRSESNVVTEFSRMRQFVQAARIAQGDAYESSDKEEDASSIPTPSPREPSPPSANPSAEAAAKVLSGHTCTNPNLPHQPHSPESQPLISPRHLPDPCSNATVPANPPALAPSALDTTAKSREPRNGVANPREVLPTSEH